MDNLDSLGDSISVRIPPDEHGFTGRECPQSDCEGYFKVEFGTGLKGENVPCHCPYCGHFAGHDHFWTKEQIEFAKSTAFRRVTDALSRDLKSLEFDTGSRGFLRMSLKVKPGQPTPIHYYREKKLETEIVCRICTLRYAVYGVFAFCPDCGQHNSLQILEANLQVVDKMLLMAVGAEKELSERLIENALEDCVSAFDGFGRQLCRIYQTRATDQAKAEKVSFQNLERASVSVSDLFRVDLSALLTADDWKLAIRAFQKRHLFAHTMGVVDQDYISRTKDPHAEVGRKISLEAGEVKELVVVLISLARELTKVMAQPEDRP